MGVGAPSGIVGGQEGGRDAADVLCNVLCGVVECDRYLIRSKDYNGENLAGMLVWIGCVRCVYIK